MIASWNLCQSFSKLCWLQILSFCQATTLKIVYFFVQGLFRLFSSVRDMAGSYLLPKRPRLSSSSNVVVVVCGRKHSACISNSEMEPASGSSRFAEEQYFKFTRDFKDVGTRSSLQLQVLEPSTKEELLHKLEILQPTVVYFCTDIHSSKQDFGSFIIGDSEVSSSEDISSLFKGRFPSLVCLEISNSLKLGEGLSTQGFSHVISWKTSLTKSLVISFRQAFFSALQSYGTELWDAFHVAQAPFQLHCVQPNAELSRNGKQNASIFLPVLLGKPPKLAFSQSTCKDTNEDTVKSIDSCAIQIFEDPKEFRLLLNARLGVEEANILPALQDGLNAILTAEVRNVRLVHRMSAPLPPAAASTLVRGMVTMRCDVCTSNFARLSFIVSGSADVCLKDELLEHGIRRELLNRSQFVQFTSSGDRGPTLHPGIRVTSCIASGASTMEATIKAPAWAGQILRQLALQNSYVNLASLGVAGVDGVSVAAFQRCSDVTGTLPKKGEQSGRCESCERVLPCWLSTPLPRKKRPFPFECTPESKNADLDVRGRNPIFSPPSEGPSISGRDQSRKRISISEIPPGKRQRMLAKLRPVPHSNKAKFVPFGTNLGGLPPSTSKKPAVVNGSIKSHHYNGTSFPTVATNDGNYPTAAVVPPEQAITLGCSVTRKHGCSRRNLEDCTEEEFLEDLMQFLVSRGHGRLIPVTGIDAFPNVILNGKKLDLYNLYREVVTRGGFYVGNGINWKGQIFPKMRNHTLTNRITGVGNTLKRHYEAYLLEYELAHDDVGGECCVLCFSGAEGDWVNCGVCRQWAHFGCDRRMGLGAFKDYAKTDGLEYICPRCSIRVMPQGTEREKPR